MPWPYQFPTNARGADAPRYGSEALQDRASARVGLAFGLTEDLQRVALMYVRACPEPALSVVEECPQKRFILNVSGRSIRTNGARPLPIGVFSFQKILVHFHA